MRRSRLARSTLPLLLATLAACARTADEWLAELASPEPFTRVLAVTALAELGQQDALPQVLAALDDPSEEVRAAAGAALARLGPPAMATLLAALKPGASAVDRERVLVSLPLLGAKAAEPLMAALFDGQHGTQAVLSALERLGPDATRSTLPGLIAALSSPAPETRALAAEAIHAVDATDRDALAALLRACRDANPIVRTAALEAAVGGLLARMRLDGLSRAAAQSQLETLGDAALPALARALREAQPGTTTEPLAALAAFGPAALGPAFDQLYHRNPQHVQRAGALAVAIGPEALPALVEMLDSTDQRRHLLALTGLGALKQAARPAVPRVLQDLHAGDPLVRWGAAYALGLIGPTDDNQLRELLALAAASDHVIHEQIAPGLVEALLDRIAARPAEADAWRAALRELGQDALPTLQHTAAGSGPRAKAAAEELAAPR